MYSLPSTSHTCAPLAFWTKNGCPPTARNARTGELTPPGMYCNASANNASDFAREITPTNYLWPAVSASKFRSIGQRQSTGVNCEHAAREGATHHASRTDHECRNASGDAWCEFRVEVSFVSGSVNQISSHLQVIPS